MRNNIGNIYRGNAPTVEGSDTTYNYIIKNNSEPYQIHVNLNTGVTASEIDVHGENREAKSRFQQLSSLTGSSPIEYYAFSMDENATDATLDWQEIEDGDITLNLPCSQNYTPYRVYLKDGCSNISSGVPSSTILPSSIKITRVQKSLMKLIS